MKVLVLASGGLDSTILLYKAVEMYGAENVVALNMYYGQRHAKEAQSYEWQIAHLGILNHHELDVAQIYATDKGCKLFEKNGEVPHGSYAEQRPNGGVVDTYVPFRNGLFLAIAASIAEQKGCDEVWYGAHKDDAAGDAYPDCSMEFVHHMTQAIQKGTAKHITMRAPWAHLNKRGIVSEARVMNVTQEEISHTWSCYEGGDQPCGKCGTCIDRKAALEAGGYENC